MSWLSYSLSYSLTHPHRIIEDIYHQLKWAYQRIFRGWDDRVTYDLYGWLTVWLPQWLRGLKTWGNSCPIYHPDGTAFSDMKEWHTILDEIIEGFEAANQISENDFAAWKEIYTEDPEDWPGLDEELPPEFWNKLHSEEKEAMKKFHRGMILFHMYFFNLWD